MMDSKHCKRMYRMRLRLCLSVSLVASVIFICYQVFSLQELNSELRGTATNKLKKSDPVLYGDENKGIIKATLLTEVWGKVKSLFSSSVKDEFIGVDPAKRHFYRQNSNMFLCIQSRKEIDISKVNDDYCDCPEDGSDEPSTSACSNGIFFCNQTDSYTPSRVPSSRVNDGICDCCDGSDEWKQEEALPAAKRLTKEIQHKLGRYLSPCSNTCNKKIS